jgi:hypothetical protein
VRIFGAFCMLCDLTNRTILYLLYWHRILRNGSEVLRDGRTGSVVAEILLASSNRNEKVIVFASFVAPWPLASADFFDVECRNADTGDGAFLAVAPPTIPPTVSMESLPDAFLVNALMGPTGRFSLYGTPTDIKFKRVPMEAAGRAGDATNDYRVIDVSFSTLSQSTQTELPRRARMVATIPRGTQQAVMLVASSSASRWNKDVSLEAIQHVTESFRAIPAPTTTLRVRDK